MYTLKPISLGDPPPPQPYPPFHLLFTVVLLLMWSGRRRATVLMKSKSDLTADVTPVGDGGSWRPRFLQGSTFDKSFLPPNHGVSPHRLCRLLHASPPHFHRRLIVPLSCRNTIRNPLVRWNELSSPNASYRKESPFRGCEQGTAGRWRACVVAECGKEARLQNPPV